MLQSNQSAPVGFTATTCVGLVADSLLWVCRSAHIRSVNELSTYLAQKKSVQTWRTLRRHSEGEIGTTVHTCFLHSDDTSHRARRYPSCRGQCSRRVLSLYAHGLEHTGVCMCRNALLGSAGSVGVISVFRCTYMYMYSSKLMFALLA